MKGNGSTYCNMLFYFNLILHAKIIKKKNQLLQISMSLTLIFALTCVNKSKRHLRGFSMHISAMNQSNFEGVSHSICCFHKAEALRAACIWFHREVVNMPVFSTSLLFWHAQLRQSSSKVSAWGCGNCRSAFTHTNLHFSGSSPQYGWMLLRGSPCWLWIRCWRVLYKLNLVPCGE